VAQALGRCLQERGHCVSAVASRSQARAESAASFIGVGVRAVSYEELGSDRVILAVPDHAIAEVARRLKRVSMVLHTSGALSGMILREEVGTAASYGSLHPLQTFPTPSDGYRTLPGCACAVDGEPDARAWAIEIATLMEGLILEIPASARALYHAAAAMASNHLTATMDAAIETMVQVGIDSKTARRALANISRAALENTLRDGATAALTGPVVRGDAGTVARHVDALRASPVSIQELYRAAARHALEIARRRGLPPEAAAAVRSSIGHAHG
jgi:predicted short-subunit dehydrogenase-like oxidoreductase (DUF2520 family)